MAPPTSPCGNRATANGNAPPLIAAGLFLIHPNSGALEVNGIGISYGERPRGGPAKRQFPVSRARPATSGAVLAGPSPLPLSHSVRPRPRPMPLRDAIEHRLRPPDQLVGLAHPVIKIAEFEFLALERCELQRLCRGRCCIRQVCIVHPTRPNQRRVPMTPQRAAGWCRCIAQWRQVLEPEQTAL